MCGIVGAVANCDIVPAVVSGLQALEYRGYDSAGIASVTDKKLNCTKCLGKISELAKVLETDYHTASIAIAHTRWATHGKPSQLNSHPHISHDKIAVVHNGTIENYEQIRLEILQLGFNIISATDSELIAHLIYQQLLTENSLLKAVSAAADRLKGAFSMGVISTDNPSFLIALRHSSPLVIGIGDNGNFIASDPIALLDKTNNFIYMEEDDIAIITSNNYKIFNQGKRVKRQIQHFKHSGGKPTKDKFDHFMLKEIYEQPIVLQDAVNQYKTEEIDIPSKILQKLESIEIIACGSSYNAGYVAYYWIKQLLRIPCMLDFASEYRYLEQTPTKKCLLVLISQSGETADTLLALRKAKELDYLFSLAICNSDNSSLAREANATLLTSAGSEISVAATKSFTTQLFGLLSLVMEIAKSKNIQTNWYKNLYANLHQLPVTVKNYLSISKLIKSKCVTEFTDINQCLFFARGQLYPIMLEAALKLKEIAYINVQAYPGGELKHGPIALIEKGFVVVALVTANDLADKFYANLESVTARGAKLILFADETIHIPLKLKAIIIRLPYVKEQSFVPLAYVIPMQLLAYYTALAKGTDIDQPRNLAKSVTVE